jgi:hypothetical protein
MLISSVQGFTDLSHGGFGAGPVTLEKGKTTGLVAIRIAYASHSYQSLITGKGDTLLILGCNLLDRTTHALCSLRKLRSATS